MSRKRRARRKRSQAPAVPAQAPEVAPGPAATPTRDAAPDSVAPVAPPAVRTPAPASAAPVAVIGGGIAGLAAAYALTKRQVPFVLLEAGDRLGGVIRTDHEAGFVLEGGPDTLLAQKPEAVALCRELGLGDRLRPTNTEVRTVYVLRKGRLHALPDGMVLGVPTRFVPFATSRLFSWPGKLRMGLDLVLPARRDAGDESIADFLLRRMGREALELIGEPLLAGIHAGDPERLSMSATFPRFVELERKHGSLIRGLFSLRRQAAGRPAPPAFYALAGGMQELSTALVERLPADSIRLRTPIRAVERDGAGFALRVRDGEPVAARSVIVAAPATPAAGLLEGLLPDLAPLLRQIPFESTATVLLGYRREDVDHPLDGYGLMVPRSEGLCTLACSFLSTKMPGRAPEGHVLLRGFLGGSRDPDALALEDRSLIHTLVQDMRGVLGLRGEPVVTRVFRWPATTPQMTVGHMDRLVEIEQHLASIPGLFLTGAGIRGTGIPDAAADGRLAAESAAQYVAAG